MARMTPDEKAASLKDFYATPEQLRAQRNRARASEARLLAALKDCESWMSAVCLAHGHSTADAAKIDRANAAIKAAEEGE